MHLYQCPISDSIPYLLKVFKILHSTFVNSPVSFYQNIKFSLLMTCLVNVSAIPFVLAVFLSRGRVFKLVLKLGVLNNITKAL